MPPFFPTSCQRDVGKGRPSDTLGANELGNRALVVRRHRSLRLIIPGFQHFNGTGLIIRKYGADNCAVSPRTTTRALRSRRPSRGMATFPAAYNPEQQRKGGGGNGLFPPKAYRRCR